MRLRSKRRRGEGIFEKHCDSHRTYAAGNGGNVGRLGLDLGEIDVAAKLSVGFAVYSDVNDNGSLLHHIALDELGLADRRDENIGLAADLCEILRSAMADSYRTVCVKQKHCHRLTNDIGATDNHALLTANLNSALLEQYHNARGGARQKIVISDHNLAHVIRVERVNVLFRLDLEEHLGFVKMLGERKLHKNSVNLIVIIKSFNKGYKLFLCTLSHRLAKRLTDVRKDGTLPYLRPDGKTQVTVKYVDGVAKRVDTVVVSTQHDAEVSQEQIREDMKKYVIDAIIPARLMDAKTKIYINPTGRFEIGGPEGDSGLTGRKIIVDTYGGRCAHGGGAFSGKDCTKVDRSAAYYCRYIAKNLVAAGLADEVEIQVAYAIGVANPVSIFVDSHGTGKLSDEALVEVVKKHFDLRPYAIIRTLELRKPVFGKTSAYGHFGREGFAWEQTDKVEQLKAYL